MESLGRYFQECRMQRGMSLEEVSARTRIRLQTLQALERDDYPSLPVEVTVKGFVRAYARCLGLDEQDVSARYQGIAAAYFRSAQPADPISRVKDTAAPEPVWNRHLTLAGLTIAALAVAVSGMIALMPSAPPDEPNAISAPGRVAPPSAPPELPAPARIPEPIQTIASVPAIPPPSKPQVSPPARTAPPRPAPSRRHRTPRPPPPRARPPRALPRNCRSRRANRAGCRSRLTAASRKKPSCNRESASRGRPSVNSGLRWATPAVSRSRSTASRWAPWARAAAFGRWCSPGRRRPLVRTPDPR